MILLLLAGLILFFLGHYSIAFILLGIFALILTAISNWLQTENEVYAHEKTIRIIISKADEKFIVSNEL